MTRRGYLALSIAGLVGAVVGGAVIEWHGSAGSVPREDWLGHANMADLLGGLLCGGGLLTVLVGLSGWRSG